ncbi:MAG TPA: DUF1571 domain-containing protein [Arachidicoccus sp.]
MRKILIVASLFALTKTSMAVETARTIIDKSIATVNASKSCVYTMKGYERVKGKNDLFFTEIFTKVNLNPWTIYGRVASKPHEGTELLFVKGQREDKVRVNPGKFLPTVTLAPTNSLLTGDQHHTILSSGFGLYSRIISDAVKRSEAQGKFDQVFKYVGDVTFDGKQCYKIVITDPTYSITTATAKASESVSAFTQRLLVPEYAVKELNGVGFESNIGGKTLKIPSSYTKQSVLYIDKATMFPLYQEMSDDKGVFERYEYYGLKVNPTFKTNEFTEDYSDYKF